MHRKTVQIENEVRRKPRKFRCCAGGAHSHARVLQEPHGALCASATALGGGGRNAELIEFVHLLRVVDVIMRPRSVNRIHTASATATPRPISDLVRRARASRDRSGGRPQRPPASLGRTNILKSGSESARKVPPSGAKLRLGCRLVDGFVSAPPIDMRANHSASFCGVRRERALWFRNWAIAAALLPAPG